MSDGPTQKSFDVFLSYARADCERRPYGTRPLDIADYLARAGAEVWVDKEKIVGGANYKKEIVRAIRASKVLVVLLSKKSTQRPDVRSEIGLAFTYGLALVPLLLEKTDLPEEIEYDFASRNPSWIEAFDDLPAASWFPDILTALEDKEIACPHRPSLPKPKAPPPAAAPRPVVVGQAHIGMPSVPAPGAGIRPRTFRLYVSSTFADLEAERNALQERVFPALHEFCRERNARFEPIDMRWGVSLEASLEQRPQEIVFGEIERCREITPRPNFLALLGNRYGWMPPPPRIPRDEFEDIRERVAEEKRDLLDWYRLDENAAPPEYLLRARFDPPETAGLEDYTDSAIWGPVEHSLQTTLADTVQGMPWDEDRRRVYEASALEQEVWEGALSRGMVDDEAFCLFREITGGPDPALADVYDPIRRYADPDQTRLRALKQNIRAKLPPEAIREYRVDWDPQAERPATDHLAPLAEDALDLLKGAIENELRDPLPLLAPRDEPPRFRPDEHLDEEGSEHRRFAEERTRAFEGRESVLDAVAAYLDDDDPLPFVLHGRAGTGKAALLAEATRRAQERDAELVYRFIGATPDSSSGLGLLRSLCLELARRYGEVEADVPDDYQKLVGDFRERLERAGASRPLFLFLDSLDQLSEADGARSLGWLPSPLPEGVRLVVSTAPGTTLKPLEQRAALLHELKPLSRDEGGRILKRWLDDVNRTLQPAQRDAVLDGFEGSDGNPMWLRLAFEEARYWRSDEPPEDLAPGVEGIIGKNTFSRLADEDNHGWVLVSRALGYLAASRYGLAEEELLDLLSRDLEVYRWFLRTSYHVPPDLHEATARYRAVDPEQALAWLAWLRDDASSQDELDEFLTEVLSADGVRLPRVIWSRLFADLRPYLIERSSEGGYLLGFYHHELAEVAHAAYLADDEERECHHRLSDYFRRQADPDRDRSWTGGSIRGLSELPYHLTESERWQELVETLTDFDFLERKAAEVGVMVGVDRESREVTTYTGPYQLQDDYAHALERMPGGENGGPRGRRRIIVTGIDLGKGLELHCPHCNSSSAFPEEWRGMEIECPLCRGPLRVTEFVAARRVQRGAEPEGR
jgi:hypothetical protein